MAGAVIFTEFVSALLIKGTFTRIAAFGIMTIMIGAILTTHLPNGFFMNWAGTRPAKASSTTCSRSEWRSSRSSSVASRSRWTAG